MAEKLSTQCKFEMTCPTLKCFSRFFKRPNEIKSDYDFNNNQLAREGCGFISENYCGFGQCEDCPTY